MGAATQAEANEAKKSGTPLLAAFVREVGYPRCVLPSSQLSVDPLSISASLPLVSFFAASALLHAAICPLALAPQGLGPGK
jgi:hypothetical protein